MKNSPGYRIARITQVLVFTLATVAAFAQTLPATQQTSLRLPAALKIDGRTSEWPQPFQAYHKNTRLSYTLANDDEYLYVLVNVADPENTAKIVKAGLTLTVNASNARKLKEGVAVTYPVYGSKQPNINVRNKPLEAANGKSLASLVDSFRTTLNTRLSAAAKELKIIGSKVITDSLISVYNDAGVKVAAQFDAAISYTCELLIPLKALGLEAGGTGAFAYNIRINGIPVRQLSAEVMKGVTAMRVVNRTIVLEGPGADVANRMSSDVDFWGEYVLAK